MEVRGTHYCVVLLMLTLLAVNDAIEFWRYPALRRNQPTSDVPNIRPIRRHVYNFLPGQRRGSVTVVYKTDVDLDVRWFRQARNVPNAEIENMLGTDGDPDYEVTSASSGDVRATTLTWLRVQTEFPYKFVTCFSVNDTLFQYQVDTVVTEPTRNSPLVLQNLPHMYWVAIPSEVETFAHNGNIELTCTAILAPESTGTVDLEELDMYKTNIGRRVGNNYGHAVNTPLHTVHRLGRLGTEGSGKYRTNGKRRRLPFGYARYQVDATITNATEEDEGMYTCALTRPRDRTYISSWVRKGRGIDIPDKQPQVELLPCASQDRRRRNAPFNIFMKRGEPTCFNCRAYGNPVPDVGVTKGNAILEESDDVHVDEHVNVPYGGLQEVTYTFWRPSSQDAGSYVCWARIGRHELVSVSFEVIIRN